MYCKKVCVYHINYIKMVLKRGIRGSKTLLDFSQIIYTLTVLPWYNYCEHKTTVDTVGSLCRPPISSIVFLRPLIYVHLFPLSLY